MKMHRAHGIRHVACIGIEVQLLLIGLAVPLAILSQPASPSAPESCQAASPGPWARVWAEVGGKQLYNKGKSENANREPRPQEHK